VRTVFRAEVFQPQTDHVYFEIEADGFLKYMVRNIVGTLVHIGQNQIPPEQIKTILEKRDRNLAGPTAPARGLFLLKVNYR
jgi:tRNA pseudouridine38-40 synthase